MIRLSILLAGILIFLTSSAQDEIRNSNQKTFYVGFHFSPEYCYRQLINNDGQAVSQTIIRSRDRMEKARLSFTTGISFAWPISPRILLESGLYFSDRGYKTNKELLVYIPPISPNAPVAVRHIYKKQFLDVPLRMIYILGDKRLQVAPAAGLVINLLLNQEQVTYNYYDAGVVKRVNTKLEDDFRKVNLSFQLGMGIRYIFNDRLRLMAEPVLRYNLFKSADTPVAEKLWTAGLNTGVYISFIK